LIVLSVLSVIVFFAEHVKFRGEVLVMLEFMKKMSSEFRDP
jgi:hypothetical protein